MNNIEHKIQRGVIEWREKMKEIVVPELQLLHAIPNGGKRDAKTGAMLKREGVLAGIPDLHLPIARKGYHSLYIEIKKPAIGKQKAGTLSDAQKKIIPLLRAKNNKVVICHSTQAVIDEIMDYLRG